MTSLGGYKDRILGILHDHAYKLNLNLLICKASWIAFKRGTTNSTGRFWIDSLIKTMSFTFRT